MAHRLLDVLFYVSFTLPGVSLTYMTTRTAPPVHEWDNRFLLESYSVRLVAREDMPPAAACRRLVTKQWPAARATA